MEVVEVCGKKIHGGPNFQRISQKKGEISTMDVRRRSKPSSPNWKPWHLMDSKHKKCVPIIRWKQLGWL
jgi:hypothetical protein